MDALPAACAVELLHNFSLVHDDIQDSSEIRRGRDTIWKLWGIPQAINIGDALLNLAYLSVYRLQKSISTERMKLIQFTLQNTCLELTKGQHLDIAYETKNEIPVELYIQMINGKTAALISASFKIGALVAGASETELEVMEKLGNSLGLAFQIQDDYLGIWGDERVTGKSIYSDLISKKKTYPVILGINNKKTFSETWLKLKDIDVVSARRLAKALELEGIRDQVYEKFEEQYTTTWQILNQIDHKTEIRNAFIKMVKSLQSRKK
jgi:geranylgeranyl diphosphate synthase type I